MITCNHPNTAAELLYAKVEHVMYSVPWTPTFANKFDCI